MTAQSELLHVWTVKEDSRMIRFYKWLYSENVSTLTFCKLFWAMVCSPIVLVLVGFASLGEKLFSRPNKVGSAPESYDEVLARMEKEAAERTQRRIDRENSWPNRFIRSVASFFDHIAAFFQAHRKLVKTLQVIFFLVVVAAVLAAAGYGLSLIPWGNIHWGYFFEQVFEQVGVFAAIFLGVFVLIIGLAYLIYYLVDEVDYSEAPVLRTTGHTVRWPFVNFWHGLVFTGKFFAFGYHTVKTRTCPRVEVVGGE